MSLVNATAYSATAVPTYDARGRRVVVVIVKATFELNGRGDLVPAAEPSPVRLADVPWDPAKPGGSIRYPTDLAVRKPLGDVVVVGSAISERPIRRADVMVKVADHEAPLAVHGERLFERGARGVVIGQALTFTEQPIVYEHAYGGVTADRAHAEERNPTGLGVAAHASDLVGTRAPQIEHPARPHETALDAHAPMGYGATPPHWLPRRGFAGTFDAAWQVDRMPLLPVDYDDRFENVAHPSLQLDRPFCAGMPIYVLGMSERRLMECKLPDLRLAITSVRARERITMSPRMDTLVIEPGRGRLELVARVDFALGRGERSLREVRVDYA